MLKPRVIPCLLLNQAKLVKTRKFKTPVYLGDPINAIKIFNEKGVDELIVLDIAATTENTPPQLDLIGQIATECFMPVCYGGGLRSIETIRDIFRLGIEKVSIGSHAADHPGFVKEASSEFGSQSVVVCIDVKRNLFGRCEVVTHNGKKRTGLDPLSHAMKMEEMGAGELLLNSVDRDGTLNGYDIDLIRSVTEKVGIPVIACGGAGTLQHLGEAVKKGGASSAAAGSLFVFHGKHRAVLISYPDSGELDALFEGLD